MNVKDDNFFKILSLVHDHEIWMDDTINLIASENRLSPLINDVLKSDLGNRVAEGWLSGRVFPGIKYYDEIEKYGIELACHMFEADFADIRPISGSMANMIVYNAFTKHGDTIASLSIPSGAHISMAGAAPKKIFGLNVVELPFNHNELTIDIERSIEIIRNTKPKIVVLGGSVLLFPQPVKELSLVCREVGTILLYDAAHVAGLIIAGEFPNPLSEGADIMTMTVCKTIPGPQHALILSREKYAEKIRRTTFPNFLSGHHLHETVASVLALEEMKTFGKSYITQVLKNAKVLANEFIKTGFDVLAKHKGYTETHMFLVNTATILPATDAEQLLERVNIIVNRNLLPTDISFLHPNGLRIGTPEITRLGMMEYDMSAIVSFFKRTLINKEDPESVKKDVTEFRHMFKQIKYCHESK